MNVTLALGSSEDTEVLHVSKQDGRWVVLGTEYHGQYTAFDAAEVKEWLKQATQ